jgi:hypothetical protein
MPRLCIAAVVFIAVTLMQLLLSCVTVCSGCVRFRAAAAAQAALSGSISVDGMLYSLIHTDGQIHGTVASSFTLSCIA